MRKILVIGGTGFIGQALVELLTQHGYKVLVIARKLKSTQLDYWAIDLEQAEPPVELIEQVDAIIHLAGSPIFQRWTPAVKESIYRSRVQSTNNLVSTIKKAGSRPKALITASATGYYGDQGETELPESATAGDDFLARVCIDWEAAAQPAEALGLRTVQVRTAPVLGQGGLLDILMPLYKVGLGGSIGSGQQWFPWIHHQDIVTIYRHCLENSSIAGPVNAAAPVPIRYQEFSQLLARTLHRPHFFRIPGWLLKQVKGEFGEAILNSQKVIPEALQKTDYRWQYPDLIKALSAIVNTNK